MTKIYCTRAIPKVGLDLLKENGHEVIVNTSHKFGSDACTSAIAQCEGLITMLSDTIDAAFLHKNPQLKIIAQFAVGYNNINTKEARKRNIAICNTPDVLTRATAELALSLLLSVSRQIPQAQANARDGKWIGWEPMAFRGKSLHDCRVGIIGAGRIGHEFARMCKGAFNSEIVYYSKTVKTAFESSLSATHVTLLELVKKCDVVSIHCPLNKDTKNMFNEEVLRNMKNNSILINTARGEIIDQEALVKILQSNAIAGVGLDVTTPEPLGSAHKLYEFDNVIITPHIGSATLQARDAMSLLVSQNIVNLFNGTPLQTEVTY